MNHNDKELFIKSTRDHWSIEGQLHYTLDTTYADDKCKVRIGNGPVVLNMMRKTGVTIFSRITNAIKKKYSIRRLVNYSKKSLSDLADLILGKNNIVV